jgi:hypothetical protein
VRGVGSLAWIGNRLADRDVLSADEADAWHAERRIALRHPTQSDPSAGGIRRGLERAVRDGSRSEADAAVRTRLSAEFFRRAGRRLVEELEGEAELTALARWLYAVLTEMFSVRSV